MCTGGDFVITYSKNSLGNQATLQEEPSYILKAFGQKPTSDTIRVIT